MKTQMLAYLQLRRQRLVRTGELTGPLRLSVLQERELFKRMARAAGSTTTAFTKS